ncbi:MAG TPA: hypothetical protein VFS43_44540 [Polyangiaceae bacterium]|nr:hypothetical protein [Polyangiaceae bacterium]
MDATNLNAHSSAGPTPPRPGAARPGASAGARRLLALAVFGAAAACGVASCAAPDGEPESVATSSAAVLVAKSMPNGSGTIGYLEHLPSDYATSGTKRYPTMIFLHGIGERGDGSPAALEKLKVHGPPEHIKNGHTMTFTVNGVTEKFIVIAPQLATSYGSYPCSWLTTVVNHTLNNYRVDPDRLYVTGLSMGGYGTYNAATCPTLAPKIAAIAPIAAGAQSGLTLCEACTIAGNDMATWAFHGDADTTVSLAKGQAMINAITNCSPAPSPAPIFTVYPGVGHNSWDRAYNTGHTYHSPNLYEWLLAQRRAGGSANRAPTVNGIANQTMTAGAVKTVAVSAADQDGNALTLSRPVGPSWATPTDNGGGSGSVRLAPGSTVSGSFTVGVRATDSGGLYTQECFSTKVNVPAPVTNGKLTVTPSMVVQESGLGDARMLVDEQATAGDPRDGTAGQPTQGWATGGHGDLPASAYIDLGEEVDLTDVYIFDTNGNEVTRNDEWVVSVGTPGNWAEVASETCDAYLTWKRHPVSARTRYVRLTNNVAYVRIGEVVLYGE